MKVQEIGVSFKLSTVHTPAEVISLYFPYIASQSSLVWRRFSSPSTTAFYFFFL